MPGSWIALFIALWAVVIFLLFLVLGLSRRIGVLEARLVDGGVRLNDMLAGAPKVGDTLPAVPGHEDLRWGTRSASAQVVLFFSASCNPCRELAGKLELQAAGNGLPESLRNSEVLIVTDAPGEPLFGHLGMGERLVTQSDYEISQRLGISASPFGLGVDADGVVRAASPLTSVQDVAGLAEACGQADPVHVSH